MLGGIAGIAVPFTIGGTHSPLGSLVAMMVIHGPQGATLPWSWPVFCIVTLAGWGLLQFSRA